MISITRLLRLGIRAAAWATPHVQDWNRKRNLNWTEGQRHLQAGNWAEAEEYLSDALMERTRSVPQTLELILNIATAQRHQGKMADAERSVYSAIELAVKERNHSMHLLGLDGLANIQLDQGDYITARKTIAEMTRLEKTQSHPDPARLAEYEHKLGAALLKDGLHAEAMGAFERAIGLCEKAFGPNDVRTGNSLAELGMLCRQKGDHPDAQRMLRRALAIHRAVSGPDSHDATQDLFQLAASLEESGNMAEAMAEYERVLAWKQRQIGGTREEMVEVQLRLAALYVQTGHIPAAREQLLHVVAVLERTGGPQLVQALETFAAAEELTGHSHEAQQWRDKALKAASKMAAQPSEHANSPV